MDSAHDFYLAAGVVADNILYVTDVPAGHAFLAEGPPNSCGVTQPDFINDCGIDQAGDIWKAVRSFVDSSHSVRSALVKQ